MKTLFLAATAFLVFSVPVFAMTDAECTTMWKQADANNDGSLSGTEASRYAAWLRVKGKTVPADKSIPQASFIENCKAGVFTNTAVDAGAPLEGANSFTEGQAQDRVLAAGYADVSAMTKDEKGIWRGTASKGGTSVKVAVDYKGNVVSG